MSAAHKAVAGQSRPCGHTRVHHEHGTYNRAHLDGCRCRACTRAHRRRRKLYAAGLRPVLPPMVPAVRVAEHISALVESGLTHYDIAQRAGLSYLSVRRHAYRRAGRCRWESVERILAIPARGAASAAGYVDATGSRRRLRALAVAGWCSEDVAAWAGLDASTLARVREGHSPSVRASTRAAVAVVYAALCAWAPQEGRRRPERAVGADTARGWVGPARWAGVDVDDPAAAPLPADGPGPGRGRVLAVGGTGPLPTGVVVDSCRVGAGGGRLVLRVRGSGGVVVADLRSHAVRLLVARAAAVGLVPARRPVTDWVASARTVTARAPMAPAGPAGGVR